MEIQNKHREGQTNDSGKRIPKSLSEEPVGSSRKTEDGIWKEREEEDEEEEEENRQKQHETTRCPNVNHLYPLPLLSNKHCSLEPPVWRAERGWMEDKGSGKTKWKER